MGYQGGHRAGRPRQIDGEVVASAPQLPRVGRWAYLWAWLKARREIRAADRATAAKAGNYAPPRYAGRHESARRVLAVEVRLDRARRSDVPRPVRLAVTRAGSREKTPARHQCAEPRPRVRAAGLGHHRLDTDSQMSVADVLAAIERSAGYVRA